MPSDQKRRRHRTLRLGVPLGSSKPDAVTPRLSHESHFSVSHMAQHYGVVGVLMS